MKANEILMKYTNGEFTVEQANEELKKIKAGYHLDPKKHELTEEEIKNGTAGLLDTGTGSMDKVQIKDGELVNCDCGNMVAFVIVGGETYKVEGKKIVK